MSITGGGGASDQPGESRRRDHGPRFREADRSSSYAASELPQWAQNRDAGASTTAPQCAQAPLRYLPQFEQSYGEKILMAPHKQGFNWVGWLAPFAAVGGGAVVVGGLIRRWGRRAAEHRDLSQVPVQASDDEMAQLEAAVRGDDR